MTYFVFFITGVQNEPIHCENKHLSLKEESEKFRDLVTFDFHDSYANLTVKSGLLLNWVLRFCPETDFVLKTDDDTVILPGGLKFVLKNYHESAMNGIIGMYSKGPRARLRKDEKHYW